MKILFITSTRIGDAVLSTGMLVWLLQQYPTAKITLVCGELPAPLFNALPNLERIYAVKKRRYGLHFAALWQKIFFNNWEMVVDLRGSALAYLLWAKKRIVYHSSKRDTRHKVEQLAGLLGVSASEASPYLWVSEQQALRAEEILSQTTKIFTTKIFFAPTANWDQKEWPIEHFIELSQLLLQKNPDLVLVILSAEHEKERVLPLLAALPEKNCLNLAGNLPLDLIPALLKKAALFVGNDSGLMHISAACGTNTIGLFGPTNADVYGAWGENCQVIRSKDNTMRGISPKEVAEVVVKILPVT